jgi:hypothetical protein
VNEYISMLAVAPVPGAPSLIRAAQLAIK